MRKIIQIVEVDGVVHALCNDGTVWYEGKEGGWKRLKDIPQDEADLSSTTCLTCKYWRNGWCDVSRTNGHEPRGCCAGWAKK